VATIRFDDRYAARSVTSACEPSLNLAYADI